MKNNYRIAIDQSKHALHHRNQGFALLEAMIALVVFAVGLLAVAQFHGTLLKTSAESKASSEALYIAQQKVDELRSVGWEELQSGSETGIEGTNDIFDIEWGVAKDGGDLAQVFVRVNGSEIEGIQLYTAISRVADIALSQSDGDGVTGSYPVDSEGDPELPTDAELGRTVDGFEVRRENGEVSEIIDPDSGDFLQLPNGGARISGNIFFLDTDFEGNLPPIQVTATGNSLCRVFPGQGRTNSTSFGDYEALGYSCHVSNGWLGNIVAFSMEPSAQVCMGSPNNRPQAVSGGGGGAVERRYFGARITENDEIVEIGITGSREEDKASIGTVCERDEDCEGSAVEVFVPGGHHFLVTREGTDCNEAMTRFSSEYVAHEMYDADSADNPNNPFYDNPAGLVCTTRPTCGAVTQTRTTFRTRMSGFLNAGSDISTADARMSGGSLECQTFGRLGDGDGSGAYWCPVTDPMRNSAQGVVGAASGSGVEVDELWGYRIERDGQGELIEKRAGRSSTSLNIEKLLDFTDFGFVLTARSEDSDNDDPSGPVDPDSGSCMATVTFERNHHHDRIMEVMVEPDGRECSRQSEDRYLCRIEDDSIESIRAESQRDTGHGHHRTVTISSSEIECVSEEIDLGVHRF